MRRVVMLPVFLTLLLAFLMAPFQHVHPATSQGGGADHDHEDTAIIHTHFDAVSVPTNRNDVASVKSSDEDHASRPLDTFTTMPQAGFSEFFLPQTWIPFFAPADLFVGVVEVTEPRGHDPPFLDFSIPRAPPV